MQKVALTPGILRLMRLGLMGEAGRGELGRLLRARGGSKSYPRHSERECGRRRRQMGIES